MFRNSCAFLRIGILGLIAASTDGTCKFGNTGVPQELESDFDNLQPLDNTRIHCEDYKLAALISNASLKTLKNTEALQASDRLQRCAVLRGVWS